PGPGLASLVTPVSVQLPAAAEDKPLVQVRIITTDAVGSDEWIGVDDISITGSDVPVSVPPAITSTSATPASVPPGGTSLLTAAVTPGANPASTTLTVSADLGAIGGSSSQAFFDDGMSGDAHA